MHYYYYHILFQGNLTVMQDLLQQGLNPNVRDNAGWTPLVSKTLSNIIVGVVILL